MKTKKTVSLILALLLSLSAFLSVMTVPAAAAGLRPPKEEDLCINGEAELDVPFKAEAPTLDGKVDKGEYEKVDNAAVQDIYSFNFGNNIGDWNEDELYEYLYSDYVLNGMNVYLNWDGQFLYFAMEADAPVGEYICPAEADSVYLFAYWCVQLGIAAPDAFEGDRFEIGIGASSDTDHLEDCYCFDSWGQRFFNSFKKGDDWYAQWDPSEGVVTYEARFRINEVIGHMPEEGDQLRFLWLLSQSGMYEYLNDAIQIQTSYGCAGPKMADQFLMLNLVGKPEDVTINPEEGDVIVEPEVDGFWGKTDFRSHDVVAMFDEIKGLEVEEREDENGDKYIRLTALGNDPYIAGKKVPIGLNADSCKWVAFKYRTTSENAKWLGLSYQSKTLTEDSDEYLISNYDEFICDGKWHIAILDCFSAPEWVAFVTNLHIWPFTDAEGDVKGSSIDLMWMKYYTEEPWFEEEEEDDTPDATEADATAADATEAGDATAADATEAEDATAAPGEPLPEGESAADATEADTAAADSGCASAVFAAALLLVPAAILFVKKKED